MLDVSLSRRLPGFELDVAFAAPPGITALFGRSGAGKTTVINMIAGLDRPDAGRVSLNGDLLYGDGVDLPPERRGLGYVFQEDRLFPHMTVARNLRYGMKRGATEIGFDDVVQLLDIGALLDRRPHGLSGGEKQRVAIGRALLASPKLILMDEPLANLDAARKAEILPFIERLRDELGLSVVYVSHAMEEIVRLADSVVLMEAGRSVAHGAVEDVMSRLDLRPLTGRAEAGSVLPATVAAHDDAYRLTRLTVPGGDLTVARLDLPVGSGLRVRVRARDVSISLSEPTDISVLNRYRGTVREIASDGGPQADILLDIGCPLWARVTRRSVDELGLAPGKSVFALVKAVAIDRHSVGERGRVPRNP
ncbi:MAG: molybdenum ABC transporter ATP-binding protein [Minwuiales bacterium]|nr:molybdenum ABC transporter ATP-binding protein [Minwuiales bacterium]